MTDDSTSAQWHIFVSYAGDDAAEVRLIVDALKSQHLRVFIDEQSVEVHDSIGQRISQGLANSAAMLVYYSRVYPTRSACQRELTAAFLSAQASGEIAQRILVVNPEPGEDHIEPVELRDLRFQPRSGDQAGTQEPRQAGRGTGHEAARPDGRVSPCPRPAPLVAVVAGAPPGIVGRYRGALAAALGAARREVPARSSAPRRSGWRWSPGCRASGRPRWPNSTRWSSGAPSPAESCGFRCRKTTATSVAAYHRSLREIAGWVELSVRGIPGRAAQADAGRAVHRAAGERACGLSRTCRPGCRRRRSGAWSSRRHPCTRS